MTSVMRLMIIGFLIAEPLAFAQVNAMNGNLHCLFIRGKRKARALTEERLLQAQAAIRAEEADHTRTTVTRMNDTLDNLDDLRGAEMRERNALEFIRGHQQIIESVLSTQAELEVLERLLEQVGSSATKLSESLREVIAASELPIVVQTRLNTLAALISRWEDEDEAWRTREREILKGTRLPSAELLTAMLEKCMESAFQLESGLDSIARRKNILEANRNELQQRAEISNQRQSISAAQAKKLQDEYNAQTKELLEWYRRCPIGPKP